MSAVQQWIFGGRLEQVEIVKHPLFLIGHYCAGTTLRHELPELAEWHTDQSGPPWLYFIDSRSFIGQNGSRCCGSQSLAPALLAARFDGPHWVGPPR